MVGEEIIPSLGQAFKKSPNVVEQNIYRENFLISAM